MNKVAVLMATHNGLDWIEEQVDSILNQAGVEVKLIISDDASSDGTLDWLQTLASKDTRVTLLPSAERAGSAGRNFYRLIQDARFDDCDFVAFVDQDDIWKLDKLSRQICILDHTGAEAVSSNVIAFWPNGRQKLINKSQPQRKFDYVFESAGPGCTFLMKPKCLKLVQMQLERAGKAKDVELHDWLVYAICRASGLRWVIDSQPTLMYRQHYTNVIGANSGLKAILSRLAKIRSGWYRNEVTKIACVVSEISKSPELVRLSTIISKKTLCSRLGLLDYVFSSRRKLTDRLSLGFYILFGIF